MSEKDRKAGLHQLWARLRFAVVGPLLASPPARGKLEDELEKLAAKKWRHPIMDEPAEFAFSTIERWYYQARGAADPMGALRRRVRKDRGSQSSISAKLAAALHQQYQDHRSWSIGASSCTGTISRCWWSRTPSSARCRRTHRCAAT